ncbi:hypothetical protein PMAYCL1PPCAC_12031, partial [Pristionchus mayeri]
SSSVTSIGMKLVLLLSMLTGCMTAISVNVNVHGEVSCPLPFYYSVNLWEQDHVHHELIGKLHAFQYAFLSSKFSVSGQAIDGMLENAVEPIVTVEHSCGGVRKCVCYDLGARSSDVDFTLNVDLVTTKLKRCDICEEGDKERANQLRELVKKIHEKKERRE